MKSIKWFLKFTGISLWNDVFYHNCNKLVRVKTGCVWNTLWQLFFPFKIMLFSSPELKAQVSFSDRLSSAVRLTVCLSVTFHFFIFFSRTAEPISTELSTNPPWMTGIQFKTNKGHSILEKEIMSFFCHNQRYGIILSCTNGIIDWNCFSCERYGPWVSVFIKIV